MRLLKRLWFDERRSRPRRIRSACGPDRLGRDRRDELLGNCDQLHVHGPGRLSDDRHLTFALNRQTFKNTGFRGMRMYQLFSYAPECALSETAQTEMPASAVKENGYHTRKIVER